MGQGPRIRTSLRIVPIKPQPFAHVHITPNHAYMSLIVYRSVVSLGLCSDDTNQILLIEKAVNFFVTVQHWLPDAPRHLELLGLREHFPSGVLPSLTCQELA